MNPETGRAAERELLLLATLPHIAFDGWNATALAAGVAEAGIDPADGRRLFPGGAAELFRLFSDRADRLMAERMAAGDLDNIGITDRVARAVRARIEALGPHREAARRAVPFLALPPNAPLAVGCLYRSVDAMWRAVGDRSADFNFYTKRALLAGVYGATLLYWFDDRSEDCAATWEFLDRRLADTMRIQRLRARCVRLAASLPDPFRLVKLARGGG